ncbi:hypothetical protein D9M68_564120 [compost metagenome]
MIEGGLHDLLAVGHRVMAGHCGAAGFADFRHHTVGRRGVGAFTVGTAAQVVDHNPRAMTGEQQRMGAANAATGAGDDYDFVFEADCIAHGLAPWRVLVMRRVSGSFPSLTRIGATMNSAR